MYLWSRSGDSTIHSRLRIGTAIGITVCVFAHLCMCGDVWVVANGGEEINTMYGRGGKLMCCIFSYLTIYD